MRAAPDLLHVWRKRNGLNQTQAADLVGLKQYEWSRLETGDRVPLADEAARIARVTDGAVPVESWEDIPRKRKPRTGTDDG